MKNKYFDTIVKKLMKYKNKIIEIEKIKKIIEDLLDTEYSETKAYKMIYYLKNRNHIESLKKDIFFVKNSEKTYTEEYLTDLFYREILKRHCNQYLTGKRYIGGMKALEIHFSSYETPDEITIVNANKQATEKIMYQKQALFKKYESNERNLFAFFNKHTKKIFIKNIPFTIAGLEIAMLETLYNQSIINKNYGEELIKKAIRKRHKSINISIREECLKQNKHHSAVNKLYKIAQTIDPEISEKIKTIIKRYSYFIG